MANTDCVSSDEEEDWTAPLSEGLYISGCVNPSLPTMASNLEIRSSRGTCSQDATPAPRTSNLGNKDGLMSRMQLNDNKAGMEGLDRERINKIIYEASKGSRFYENELKKEKEMAARVEDMQRQLARLSAKDLEIGEQEADLVLRSLEVGRNLNRTIVHVDMDMFFAAVEMKDDPALADVPMAVGSSSMLSTSNYIARKFGVRAAMPGFIALKLCPNLVIVSSNYEKYTAVSKDIRAVMAEYDPNFSPMSLDEAFLDMTSHLERRAVSSAADRTFLVVPMAADLCVCDTRGLSPINTSLACRGSKLISDKANSAESNTKDQLGTNGRKAETTSAEAGRCHCVLCHKVIDASQGKLETFGLSAEESVREMRARIHWETKLTASAGIAPNTMLAKVCSDQNKPNGQYYLPPSRDAVLEFVSKLDIRKVCGIGKVGAQMLRSIGVNTCSDLVTKRGVIYHLYSDISFNYFLRISIGIGSTKVERDGERKSMSVERTFAEIHEPKELYKKCEELSKYLADDLNDEQLVGRTVGIKLKTVNFRLMTRAQSLRNVTCDTEQIYMAARELLRTEIQLCQPEPLRLRLMGVRMSNLMSKNAIGDQRQSTITRLLSKMNSKPSSPASTSNDYQLYSSCIPSTTAMCNSSNTFACETDKAQDPELAPSSDKPLKNDEPLICPICSQDVCVPNIDQFNLHVDNCLRQTQSDVRSNDAALSENEINVGILPKPDKTIDSILVSGSDSNLEHNFSKVDAKEAIKLFDSKQCEVAVLEHTQQEVSQGQHLEPKGQPQAAETDQIKETLRTIAENLSTEQDSKVSSQVLICPICNMHQGSQDLTMFNKHLDKCLNQGALISNSPAPARLAKPLISAKRSVKNSRHTGTKKKSINTMRQKNSVQAVNNNPSSASSEEMLEMACPVCELNQQWTSLNTFNRHVDSCLNRIAIREMLNSDITTDYKRQSSSPLVEPSPKRKKSASKGTQRIDAFFKC